MSDDYSGTYDSGSYEPQPIEDLGPAPTEAEISVMSDQAVYILLTNYMMEAGRPAPYRDSRAQNRAALRRLASERRHRR